MSDERIDRDDCYICSRGNPDVLERHHIIPRRFDGADEPPNCVDLCPTCHQALESLYDARFWAKVGALTAERKVDVIVDDLETRIEELQWEIRGQLEQAKSTLRNEYLRPDYERVCEKSVERLSDGQEQSAENEDEEEDDREFEEVVLDRVRALQEEYNDRPGTPESELTTSFMEEGFSHEEVEDAIQSLRDQAEIYSPDQDHVRLI